MESTPGRISVQTHVLNANQQTAAANRERFATEGLLVMNLMSAPGAGKTTLLEATIKALQGQFQLAVIEGDLQTDLDAQRIEALGVRAYQITTGTVCHLDARMVARALDAFPISGLDLLVVENVGNLICPASFDLGEGLRVVVCSVAEGAEKPKKYPVMFNKANVVLINKIDLAAASGADLNELMTNVRDVNPDATIFALSSRTGEGMGAWIHWLQQAVELRAVPVMAGMSSRRLGPAL
ncbi:Hydrogenase nickel incorporation protein HypB [Bryocella elongata]|uniref:Hydrogenase nickel incorporation protein HypB n=1 Tax=Bryocella elongata TaxID=863522 RepID=A0A1H5S3H8_9BACT|nr:hydrogenase nickel incorporation protein HypB [Bryocella elongata]SEF44377.1 Hydrogenase nickel incorporation protein HypB [Bryocella elongata]